MTGFDLVAEIGGIAQLTCPCCFTNFIKAAYMLDYRKVEDYILVGIECPICGLQNYNRLED